MIPRTLRRPPFLVASGLLVVLLVTAVVAVRADRNLPAAVPTKVAKPLSKTAERLELVRITSGLTRPVWVGSAPGDDALYVAEQTGKLVRVEVTRGTPSRTSRRTVIDLSAETKVGAEQGLLGVAFAPDFATSGRLILHYSDRRGDTRIIEVKVRDKRADPTNARVLLTQRQPEENHNGGAMAFGHDGRLYIGLGDGGGAFDPRDAAQDPESRLGKILAADLETPSPPQWKQVARGLRNPWRFSFDLALGELWIGDVGQDNVEEISRFHPEPDEAPKNLGWPAFEGSRELDRDRLTADGVLVGPTAEYRHVDGNCSVTGGVLYRGRAIDSLRGRYVFGDFCSGAIWTLRPLVSLASAQMQRERALLPQLTHIGTDALGELVLASADGSIWAARPARR